jgi:hypothetical protein
MNKQNIYSSCPIGGVIVFHPAYEHIMNITIRSENESVLAYHEQLCLHLNVVPTGAGVFKSRHILLHK